MLASRRNAFDVITAETGSIWVLAAKRAVILAIIVTAWQQNARALAQQDPAAVSAVQLALSSMGGPSNFSAVRDTVMTAQTLDRNGQSAAPQITWKTSGLSVRCETTFPSGTSIYTVQNGIGHAKDTSGSVSAMEPRMASSIFPPDLPGVVLLYLLNAADRTLTIVSDNGSNPSMIHIQSVKLASDQTPISETQQDWYVDTKTGLPTRVDYVIPNSSAPDGSGTIQFTSWQKTSTLLVPQTLQTSQNGSPPTTLVLGAPSFNQGLAASLFQLP
jgi:hypothetical protein